MHSTVPAALSRHSRTSAFSLLEVVVAIGVFAGGLLGVIALFIPVARAVADAADAEAAVRLADPLRIHLHSRPWSEVASRLKSRGNDGHALTLADARPDYDPAMDPQVLFASRDGHIIGSYADAVWTAAGGSPDREKFFEIALIRLETISPAARAVAHGGPSIDPDVTASMLAYVARVRWPAFVRQGDDGAVQVGSHPGATVRHDHSLKQVLFFTGFVAR